ncbi:3'5'-cyclic nucleotide phosphodiesterase family protein, partial [Aphelenchoides avenae]
TSKPRVSNITFSTVTSATGLPTIAAEPSRPRSSSYWQKPHDKEPSAESQNAAAAGQTATSPSPTAAATTTASLCLPASGASSALQANNIGAHSLPNHFTGFSYASNKTGAPSSTETSSASAAANAAPQAQRDAADAAEQQRQAAAPRKGEPQPSTSATPSVYCRSAKGKSPVITPGAVFTLHEAEDEEADSEQSADSSPDRQAITVPDGTMFHRGELVRDKDLDNISLWAFPIFDFASRYPGTCLTRMTYAIFKQANLFRIFKISPAKFFNYFHALETGYWDIPCKLRARDFRSPWERLINS